MPEVWFSIGGDICSVIIYRHGFPPKQMLFPHFIHLFNWYVLPFRKERNKWRSYNCHETRKEDEQATFHEGKHRKKQLSNREGEKHINRECDALLGWPDLTWHCESRNKEADTCHNYTCDASRLIFAPILQNLVAGSSMLKNLIHSYGTADISFYTTGLDRSPTQSVLQSLLVCPKMWVCFKSLRILLPILPLSQRLHLSRNSALPLHAKSPLNLQLCKIFGFGDHV